MSSNHKFTVRLLNHRKFRTSLVFLLSFSIIIGLAVVPVERFAPHARIHSFEDGLWWAVTTVTGVGYGDMVPVTTLGRVLGAILEISGVVMFGLLIGIIGITLTKKQEEYAWFRLFERIDQLEGKIDDLEKKMQFIVQNDTKVETEE